MHARAKIEQAFPKDRDSGPLCPDRCTGTWYSVDDRLGAELVELDAGIAALFRKWYRGEASDAEQSAAYYLRQAIDHWLHLLHKKDQTANSEKPLPLMEVADAAVKNALQNMRDGTPWDRGIDKTSRRGGPCEEPHVHSGTGAVKVSSPHPLVGDGRRNAHLDEDIGEGPGSKPRSVERGRNHAGLNAHPESNVLGSQPETDRERDLEESSALRDLADLSNHGSPTLDTALQEEDVKADSKADFGNRTSSFRAEILLRHQPSRITCRRRSGGPGEDQPGDNPRSSEGLTSPRNEWRNSHFQLSYYSRSSL